MQPHLILCILYSNLYATAAPALAAVSCKPCIRPIENMYVRDGITGEMIEQILSEASYRTTRLWRSHCCSRILVKRWLSNLVLLCYWHRSSDCIFVATANSIRQSLFAWPGHRLTRNPTEIPGSPRCGATGAEAVNRSKLRSHMRRCCGEAVCPRGCIGLQWVKRVNTSRIIGCLRHPTHLLPSGRSVCNVKQLHCPNPCLCKSRKSIYRLHETRD